MVNEPLPPIPDPPERAVALAYTPARHRAAFASLLALDTQLGRSVARASEAILAQVRLAWWRERLVEALPVSAGDDPVLRALRDDWGGATPRLQCLVDGWEHLVGDAPLATDAIGAFAAGRGSAMAEFARLCDAHDSAPAAHVAGTRWALVDFAHNTSVPAERDAALRLARDLAAPVRLPAALRGIAVLDGLAARAVRTGQGMLCGRASALAAMRLGMVGR